ncbi:uncharacterized protein LOC131687636 [Topomyia yanbarensis]|uniref:uncharacterized protein LOC131687636 n=1 Tax=Topomyia yanbarensis TaxID=2498891 RepID=UPI00273A78C5|nr:uncharacterized protein LOC131687636 [Topomyia yanbarensis]
MAGFYETIDNEFGSTVKIQFKQYADNNRKLSCMEVRKEFLLRCRRNGVFPDHIQNSFKCLFELMEDRSPYLRKMENCVAKFKKTILNLEIKQTFYKIKVYQSNCEHLRKTIKAMVPEPVSKSFLDIQHSFHQQQTDKNRKSITKKYQRLLTKFTEGIKSSLPTINNKALYNATTVAIPSKVEMLLSLGAKFALPYTSPSEIPFYHIIADVEGIIKSHTDTDVQERTRCAIANNIQNFIHQSCAPTNPQVKLYNQAEKQTRIFFKQHPEVLVLQSDKGNKTVIMDKEDYTMKMKILIGDEQTYEKVGRDPTSA